MNGLNLFGKEWANIVFDGRNKMYGAYKLREENGKTTFLALAIGLGLLSLVLGSSYLYASKNTERIIFVDNDPILVTPIIDTEVPVEKVIPQKKEKVVEIEKTDGKEKAARTDVQKNIRYTEANVVADHLAKDHLASQKQFTDDTNSGSKNSEADLENGTLKKNGESTGEAKSGDEGTKIIKEGGKGEVVTNDIIKIVQHKAIPNEGFEKFYTSFSKKFNANNVNNNVSEIVIKLKFVVEKDGSFTDIQVLDDKLGLGQEAIRVLKNMPKWKPAEHNGRTVRSMFTLPIKIKVNN